MPLTSAVLTTGDIDDRLGAQWDTLSGARRDQGDFFDSHAWFASLVRHGGPGAPARLRIPAVFHGDRLAALLLLEVRGHRAWSYETGRRLRSRVLVSPAVAEDEAAGLLAEAVASLGARTLRLHRLPGRDPATRAFLRALGGAGYSSLTRPAATDMLASAGCDWGAYRRRLRGFDRYAARYTRRVRASWDLAVAEYGGPSGKPIEDCFPLYAGLQARSWRGPFKEWVFQERCDFLRRADLNGWARVHVLTVAGRPAAVQVWLRVGDVVIGRSTAYDRDLAPLNPGSVLEWAAQERLFAEARPPVWVDHLPGRSAEKERLVDRRPALLETLAVRRTPLTPVTLPVRSFAAAAAKGAGQRARARWRALGRTGLLPGGPGNAGPGSGGGRPGGGGCGPRPGAVPSLPAGAGSGAGAEAGGSAPAACGGTGPARDLAAVRLTLTPVLRRYLALAGGHRGPDAAERAWGAGAVWWRLDGPGGEPVAVARTGPGGGHRVCEVHCVRPETEPEDVVGALGGRLVRPLALAPGADAVCRAPLPWPKDAGEPGSGG